jgi:ParB family chromosome partitioning protein
VPKVKIDTARKSNACHLRITDTATRGLIRDLADNPAAALTVLIAHLFKVMVIKSHQPETQESALNIRAEPYSLTNTQAISLLDGEVRSRLKARCDAYAASGLRPIPWIETLAFGERMAFLAELAALSLHLREDRTDGIRGVARAEAAEMAQLCHADIAQHWTPDAEYLSVHSKAQLLVMAGDMGLDDPLIDRMKKSELVARLVQAAAERGYAPRALDWRQSPEDIVVAKDDDYEADDEEGSPSENPAEGHAADPEPDAPDDASDPA